MKRIVGLSFLIFCLFTGIESQKTKCRIPVTAPRNIAKVINQCQDEIKTSILSEAVHFLSDIDEEQIRRKKRETFSKGERKIAGCLLQCVYRKMNAVNSSGFPTMEGLVALYTEDVEDRDYILASYQAVHKCLTDVQKKQLATPHVLEGKLSTGFLGIVQHVQVDFHDTQNENKVLEITPGPKLLDISYNYVSAQDNANKVVSIAPSKSHDVETSTEANFRNEIEPQAVPDSYTTNVDDSPYVEEPFQDSGSSYAPSEEYGSDSTSDAWKRLRMKNKKVQDGSYSFGYNNPDSYHQSQANRNNVVRGEFGSRNPATEIGAIDSIQYTAGPRGFRPRGKNVVRKYDFNQAASRPIGSPDDPYFDPNEDPSYNFAFNTRPYSRQEASNRVGDVTGKYSYLDDVGERHNVEYIAGKNTGFHVKSAIPDNKPLSFSPLQYVGKRKPVLRGRTTVQRGLDGSYRFVSGGPDHRRTETSDSTGHVRGSYTYLDDKGVRHSVHYIAGPETGYRVLKNVKGPHLPTIFPFGRPEIVPPEFYDFPNGDDVFDAAATGFGRPQSGSGALNVDNSNYGDDFKNDDIFGKPGDKNLNLNTNRPALDRKKPSRPTYEDDGSDIGDIFGGTLGDNRDGGDAVSSKPFDTSYKPQEDDGSYKPSGENDGSYRPDINNSGAFKPDRNSKPTNYDYSDSSARPTASSSNPSKPDYDNLSNEVNNFDLFNAGSTSQHGSGYKNQETLVTNIGDKLFSVPPGVSVRAHVQAIDLLSLEPRSPSPSDQLKAESTELNIENTNSNERVEKRENNKDAANFKSERSSR
ncbi:hypothetical protein FQA39_LY08823 [Lamprigera yunnana]|nr:hypothetical protein FQA39_LY08823 [Lamprigera yunnana]